MNELRSYTTYMKNQWYLYIDRKYALITEKQYKEWNKIRNEDDRQKFIDSLEWHDIPKEILDIIDTIPTDKVWRILPFINHVQVFTDYSTANDMQWLLNRKHRVYSCHDVIIILLYPEVSE